MPPPSRPLRASFALPLALLTAVGAACGSGGSDGGAAGSTAGAITAATEATAPDGLPRQEPTSTREPVPTASTAPPATEPDSASTIDAPATVPAADGDHAFVYGAPAGQNNAQPRRVIISLPGHGTAAADDYQAWLPHLQGGTWALASFDWWDGQGETTQNYASPPEVVSNVKAFLRDQGYTAADVVVLEGFSRGSANTYAVMGNDRVTRDPVFDAVISASGKYQDGFPIFDGKPNAQLSPSIFDGVPWVLACGGQDENPDRDGCPGMTETQAWLTGHGADVLGLLEDPDVGHGAFHLSELGLPAQALQLILDALSRPGR